MIKLLQEGIENLMCYFALEWLVLLLRILGIIPGSSLGPETLYTD